MIDEKKLIEAIEKEFEGVCVYDVSPSQAIADFVDIVDKQPKVGEWIPCSERLPNQDDNNINDSSLSIPVLVQYKDITTEPEVLHYNTFTKKFCYDQIDVTSNVVAWMPLPALYNVNI